MADFSLDDDLLQALHEGILRVSAQRRSEVVFESGTDVVRAVHGCHRYDPFFGRIVRHPQFVQLAQAILGEDVYLYQFKINMKQPFEGAAWPWHQDFTFWHNEDGMALPKAVNLMVFMDDVHEANGPLTLIPGTHVALEDLAGGYERRADWRSHVAADLAYTIPAEIVKQLVAERGEQILLAPAGRVCAFHPSLVHASSSNLSPDRRAMMILTYNAVSNAPASPTRPEFLVSRDATPLPVERLSDWLRSLAVRGEYRPRPL